MTNLFRRDAVASLLIRGEAWKQPLALRRLHKAASGQPTWLRTEWRDGEAQEAERPAGLGESGRGQSLHSTDAAMSGAWAGSKTARREGRQEVG